MKHRHSRILTTQAGNLARPQEVAQGLPRKPVGAPFGPGRAQLQMTSTVYTGAIAHPGEEAHNRSRSRSCVRSSGASIS